MREADILHFFTSRSIWKNYELTATMGPKNSATKKKKNSRDPTPTQGQVNTEPPTHVEREPIVQDDAMEDLYADPPGNTEPPGDVGRQEDNDGIGDITTRAEPGDMSQLELIEFEEVGGLATRDIVERFRGQEKQPGDQASESSSTQVTPEVQPREEAIKKEMPLSDIERRLRNRIRNNDHRSELYTSVLERLQAFQREVSQITERQNSVYDTIFEILEEAGEFDHLEGHDRGQSATGRTSESRSTARATRASETESISHHLQTRRSTTARHSTDSRRGGWLEPVEEREDESEPRARTSYGPDSDTRLRGAGLSNHSPAVYTGVRNEGRDTSGSGIVTSQPRYSAYFTPDRNQSEEIPIIREDPPHFNRSVSFESRRHNNQDDRRSTTGRLSREGYSGLGPPSEGGERWAQEPRVPNRGTPSHHSSTSSGSVPGRGPPRGGGPPGGGPPYGGGPPGRGPPYGGGPPGGGQPGGRSPNNDHNDGHYPRQPAGGPPGGPPDGDDFPEDENYDDEDDRSSQPPGDPIDRSPPRERPTRRTGMRSPTPYDGPNPPHGFYQPPSYMVRFDERTNREKSSTEWIRKAIRDKLSTPANVLPALKGLKLQPPERYEGKDSIEDFANWISQLFRWMRLAGLSGPDLDRSRVDVLGQVLAGEALQWYNSVVDNPNSTTVNWDFENSLIALYTRFVHRSTVLTATEKFDNAQYTKNGGAIQLANELKLQGSRMVVVPDEYTVKRKFWGALPNELVHIMGRLKGLSPEKDPLDLLVAEAAGIEDSIRSDNINRRSRPTPSPVAGPSNPTHTQNVGNGKGRATHTPNQDRERRRTGNSGRFRPRNNDRKLDRPSDRVPSRAHTTRPEAPRPRPTAVAVDHRHPKHNHPKGSCFVCGSMDHWAADCPNGDRKDGPAVRMMDETVEQGETTETVQTVEDEPVGHNSDEGDLEGSQYDPDDELPEELYDEYSDQEYADAWMGGMRPMMDGSDSDEVIERLHSMTDDGEIPLGEQWGIGVAPPETRVAYELELEHQRSLMWATQYENRQLQQSIHHLTKENGRLMEVNDTWARHLEECRVELRRIGIAIRTDATRTELEQMVRVSTANQHRRMVEREQAFCSIYPDEEEIEGSEGIPDLITVPGTPPESPVDGPTANNVWIDEDETHDTEPVVLTEEGTPEAEGNSETESEVLFVINEPTQREYRTTITPKEARPQRIFRCMTVYVIVNGMKGLALLDSGSSVDCVSPEFARVARLPVFPLDKPVGLQLGCVGSRSSINFGVRDKVLFGGRAEEVYLDVVNVDHYDLILGVPFLRQFRLKLNFDDDTVVIGGNAIPSLKKGEEVRTARPMRRAPTGTAAKYQWAEKNQYEAGKPMRRASTGSLANFKKPEVGKSE